MQSRFAAFRGRADEAFELASHAVARAKQSGDQGLHALTLSYMGFYNLSLGRVSEGSEQQNHAAAIALSSESDPITGNLVYCNILWSCRTFADWDRACQWSDGFETWCQASFAAPTGACDLHRAEILGAKQSLPEALAHINRALAKLTTEQAWCLGDGRRVRGDIHAMISDLPAARSDYAAAYALGWDAEPGNANLLFESGDQDAALAALDRALAGTSWFHLQRRGYLLVNKARTAAHGGRRNEAAALLDEIEAAPERWPQPAVRALITETRATLDGPENPQALPLLHLARQLWTSAGIDYHATRVRLELARRLRGAGDAGGAAAELAAARVTAMQIGSHRLADRAAALERELKATPLISER